jgi:hypothetical protein
MEELLKTLSEHPFVPIGGILLGIIGIVLAVIFYVKSRRVSKVRYDCTGRFLVEGLSGALDGIEVRYKGSSQERITVSRFVFWNAGTETIRSADFTDDILRIECKQGITILDHRIVDANDETNKIETGTVASNEYGGIFFEVHFDYLDSNDGAVIQIVHDGDDLTRFSLAGSLKGNCNIRKAESPANRVGKPFKYFPFFGVLTKNRWFGWAGAFVYLGIAIVSLVGLFRGGSWWLLALAAFCIFGTWVMIYAYVTGQVPARFQRELGKLPTANKTDASDGQ